MRDAHHFRTWVERYVYLEGEDKARIDSQQDPVNIAASGSEKLLSSCEPGAFASVTTSGLRVCAFAECDTGATNVTCGAGSPSSSR